MFDFQLYINSKILKNHLSNLLTKSWFAGSWLVPAFQCWLTGTHGAHGLPGGKVAKPRFPSHPVFRIRCGTEDRLHIWMKPIIRWYCFLVFQKRGKMRYDDTVNVSKDKFGRVKNEYE